MKFRKCLLAVSFCVMAATIHVSAGKSRTEWVDSVYNSMAPDEQLAQLFMVAAYSGGENYNKALIDSLVSHHLIGGLIFMQGTPEAQARLTNLYNAEAQVPLLIGMDAEWGLGMRLTGVENFPHQMMIGATKDADLMYEMAMAVAYQCKRLGVHVDFAPDIDINNNPNNPVINFRSFGERKELVAKLGIAYMKGLQDNGIIACAKHFPGHGDVNVDSHLDLPTVNKSLDELEKLEFYPFRKLIDAGVKSVMIAHLHVPSIDSTPGLPTTLSYNVVTNILKRQLGFNGLVFTDALNMKGVTKNFPDGETDLKAFLAGNDVLLFSQNVPLAIRKIDSAIAAGLISRKEVEERVKKVLSAKYDAGLSHFLPIQEAHATEDLNQYTRAIKQKITDAAITVVRDENGILNKLNSGFKKVVYVGIGADGATAFGSALAGDFSDVTAYYYSKYSHASKEMLRDIARADVVIIGVHNLKLHPKNNFGLSDNEITFMRQLASLTNSIVNIFGNAYAARFVSHAQSVVVAYEDDDITEKEAARVLHREIYAKGTLPVTPGTYDAYIPVLHYVPDTDVPAADSGKSLPATGSLAPGTNPRFVPDAAKTVCDPTDTIKMAAAGSVKRPEYLIQLDKFIRDAIAKKAFPGCQVVALKDGKVILDKSYGTLSYGSSLAVNNQTLFDIASVSKIAATTLAVMKLYEEGKLDLNAVLGQYLPFVKGTDKANIRIMDLLLHQAGLKSWIPFYRATLTKDGKLDKKVYASQYNTPYVVPVAPSVYMNRAYVDTMWQQILASPLSAPGHYEYSDLDFYFLQQVAERLSGQSLDKYVYAAFYQPMGLQSTGYNPWNKNWQSRCAPTEDDETFRMQQIQGYVHDPGAAMLGGVAGHAGIFTTGEELAAIMQMLLDGGIYNGHRYLQAATIRNFSQYHSSVSRRGYGFDKPEKEPGTGGPAAALCSKQAFGHQGFTGTCAWADPGTGIVFVFLSNRVNPNAENHLINQMNVRTTVQDYVYKAVGIDH